MTDEREFSVEVRRIDNPNSPPPADAEWVQVQIELTNEQRARLRELGVNTERLTINTYDISRLAVEVNN